MEVQLLAQTPLFMNLPESELERLGAEMRVLELPTGTVLFHEGDASDRFYIVLEGRLEVVQTIGTHDERILAVRGKGEFIGELGLLNPDGRRTASVRSRDPVRLWEMTREDFDRLIQRHPSLAYEMARELGARMTAAQAETIKDLQAKNLQLTLAYEELKAAQAQIIEKEKLERELQVAHGIQMSILPQTLPLLAGYEFGARIMPARAVGGDFYDLILLDPDRLGVIVGDVAGKGVPAAIFMAQIHALLHVAADLCSTPREVLQRVNHQLVTMGGLSLFATVVYGVLDARSGEFAYARAGHEPPMLALAGGKASSASWDLGQPLGLLDDPILDEQTLTLPPGSTLLLYSDGIIDARSPEGGEFGRDRLVEKLAELIGNSAQGVCDELWQTLEAHQADSPQFDDATLVAIRLTVQ
jgi:sigma-B regulation protein RsbU (phosphoserine phosphatase)